MSFLGNAVAEKIAGAGLLTSWIRLTGAGNAAFHGTPADFTVKSPTVLVATVPEGVSTGFVTVTTPTGTSTSNVPFRVRPQLN